MGQLNRREFDSLRLLGKRTVNWLDDCGAAQISVGVSVFGQIVEAIC